MEINAKDMLSNVIRPTLAYLSCLSNSAEALLIGTYAAQYIPGSKLAATQGNATKYGVYQIQADTHQKIWDEYLAFDPDLASCVRGLASQHLFLKQLHQLWE